MAWWQRFVKRRRNQSPPSYRRFAGRPSDVEVFDRGNYRIMRFVDQQKLIQGKQHLKDPLDFGLEYLQQHLVASLIADRPRAVLVLGLGVGALPRLIARTLPDATITVIEHNSAVLDAAVDQFGFVQSSTMTVAIEDAVEWCNRNNTRSFDLIFNDCFDGLEGSLKTRKTSHLQTLNTMLSTKGVLITNTIKPECSIPAATYQYMNPMGYSEVWAAPNKSNLSLIFSRCMLQWEDIEYRARRLDESGVVPLRLEDEVRRLRQAP